MPLCQRIHHDLDQGYYSSTHARYNAIHIVQFLNGTILKCSTTISIFKSWIINFDWKSVVMVLFGKLQVASYYTTIVTVRYPVPVQVIVAILVK